MSDPIDDLLDRSAPPLIDRGAGRDAAMVQMVRDARDTVRAPRAPRRRLTAASGLLALLLTGGAGVAVANLDWPWIPEVDSTRSYSYDSPNGGRCELRFGNYTSRNPLRQAEVDGIIDDVFADPGLAAKAAPLATRNLARIESEQAADTDHRRAEVNAWMAQDQAVNELVYDALAERGYDTDENEVSGSANQLHCESEQQAGGGREE